MKQQLSIIAVLILLMLLAQASRWFVELPVYPVSPLHPLIVFGSGAAAVFCLGLGELRKSYALWASGLAFTFLVAATALFPDLWMRHPSAALAGLVITQAGAMVLSPRLATSGRWALLLTVLVGAVSVLPLLSTVYYVYNQATQQIAGVICGALLAAAAGLAWFRRQRSFAAVAMLTLAFWTGLVVLLLMALFWPEYNTAENRMAMEEGLLTTLAAVGALYVFDQLQSEQQIRSHRRSELQASMKDPLTDVANRRGLETFGPVLVKQAQDAGRAVSVLMADIDHFKTVNDTHGHPVGDQVLRKTAETLSSQVRQSDLVARYGGEEFVILLPGSPLAPALRLAEKIRSQIEAETVVHDGQVIGRTVSIGVATAFPEDPATLMELVRRADNNLYRAKRQGRNRVCADELPAADF